MADNECSCWKHLFTVYHTPSARAMYNYHPGGGGDGLSVEWCLGGRLSLQPDGLVCCCMALHFVTKVLRGMAWSVGALGAVKVKHHLHSFLREDSEQGTARRIIVSPKTLASRWS